MSFKEEEGNGGWVKWKRTGVGGQGTKVQLGISMFKSQSDSRVVAR